MYHTHSNETGQRKTNRFGSGDAILDGSKNSRRPNVALPESSCNSLDELFPASAAGRVVLEGVSVVRCT